MQSKIREILLKIESLNNDLKGEYERLSEKYGFFLQQQKIVFLKKFATIHRSQKTPLLQYIFPRNLHKFRSILSMPFIYGMIIPVIFLDICVTIYQWGAFTLYKIPYVKRSEYIVYDRRFLDYLNVLEKINCLYCSYVNGVFAYAVEIGARTERYWCPLKSANKPRFAHGWYRDFADYGNPEDWQEKIKCDENAFIDAYGEKCFIK